MTVRCAVHGDATVPAHFYFSHVSLQGKPTDGIYFTITASHHRDGTLCPASAGKSLGFFQQSIFGTRREFSKKGAFSSSCAILFVIVLNCREFERGGNHRGHDSRNYERPFSRA